MNKFKKACEDLANYLNRDTKGLELLSKVTRAGNEIRKELASASDAKERADESCKLQIDAAAKASAEASKAKAERQQHLDTIASLRCKIANLEKHLEEDGVEAAKTLEITPREVSRLVRDALRDKQHLINKIQTAQKLPLSRKDACQLMSGGGTEGVIVLKEHVSNLGYQELAKLGRIVALHAIMLGYAIVNSERFGDIYDADNPESQAVEATNRLFLRFLKPRCDFSKDEKKRAMYVGSESEPIMKNH
jgi:hypothetical protein